ncbi:unnamed protein product [Anisakis simplex]|uniref:Pyruvate decarboxylase n=1 Tax=Anisakis simplex TaxID=6269 RepID=A0A0M3J366_ANISI|nr:unnamed protein product [Anisakis simplex]
MKFAMAVDSAEDISFSIQQNILNTIDDLDSKIRLIPGEELAYRPMTPLLLLGLKMAKNHQKEVSIGPYQSAQSARSMDSNTVRVFGISKPGQSQSVKFTNLSIAQ